MIDGLDAWLTREPDEPATDPHAPWVTVWLTREGDHDYAMTARCNRCHRPWTHPPKGQVASGVCSCGGLVENVPGSWGVEHGGDVDAETTMVVGMGTYAEAVEAAERCNAVHAYVEARDCDSRGICRVCGDLHGEASD